MTSPFAGFENATITVTYGGEMGDNPETGNWEPINPTVAVFKAFLKPAGSQIKPEPGIDSARIRLSGFLVEPMKFPEDIKLPAQFPCEIKNSSGTTQRGILEVDLSIDSGLGIGDITGAKIEGYLTIEDGK